MPNCLMCFSYRRCTWPVIRQSSNQSAEFTRTHNNSKKISNGGNETINWCCKNCKNYKNSSELCIDVTNFFP